MSGAQVQGLGEGREDRIPLEIREVQDILDNSSQLPLNKNILIICYLISEIVLFKLFRQESLFPI